jgi:hypothetical protein
MIRGASPSFHDAPRTPRKGNDGPFQGPRLFFPAPVRGLKPTAIDGLPLQGNKNASGLSYLVPTVSSVSNSGAVNGGTEGVRFPPLAQRLRTS